MTSEAVIKQNRGAQASLQESKVRIRTIVIDFMQAITCSTMKAAVAKRQSTLKAFQHMVCGPVGRAQLLTGFDVCKALKPYSNSYKISI